MDWAKIGKLAVKAFTIASVNQAVGNVIESTTPETATKAARFMSRFAGFVISSMVAEEAGQFVIEQLDGFIGEKPVEEEPVIEAE